MIGFQCTGFHPTSFIPCRTLHFSETDAPILRIAAPQRFDKYITCGAIRFQTCTVFFLDTCRNTVLSAIIQTDSSLEITHSTTRLLRNAFTRSLFLFILLSNASRKKVADKKVSLFAIMAFLAIIVSCYLVVEVRIPIFSQKFWYVTLT